MVVYGHRALLVRCNNCGRLMKYDLNIFEIVEKENLTFSCKCGKENISLRKSGNKTYWIKILCFGCGQEHLYRYSLKNLIYKDLLFTCENGIKTCFIGDTNIADKLVNNYDLNFGAELVDEEFDEYFKNFKILAACLNKVDRLMIDGRIGCSCGNEDINIEIFSDRIEVKCLNCGSVQIIYAETKEDLDLLLRKEKIVMQKHNISCIDSILEKDKDLK